MTRRPFAAVFPIAVLLVAALLSVPRGVGAQSQTLNSRTLPEFESATWAQGNPESIVPIEFAIPAACLVAGQLKPGAASATCHVIDAVQLGVALDQALVRPDAMLAVLQALGLAGGQRIVAISLGPGGGAVSLVQAQHEQMARVFRTIGDRIQTEMQDDPAKAASLRQFALADVQAVQALRARVFAEHAAVVNAATEYLTTNPQAQGIRFHCLLACQQLVSAAQGANVFDTAGPRATAQAEPADEPSSSGRATSPAATALMVGGVAVGAGLGTKMLLDQLDLTGIGSCDPAEGSRLAQAFNSACLGGGGNCSSARSAYQQWCEGECNLRFDVATGSCR